MQPIALARMTYVLAYVDVLRRIGAPVERELRRARLPTLLDELSDTYVSAVPVLGFLESIARSEGVDDLPLLVTERGTFRRLRTELQNSIRSAPTLYARLQRLGEFVSVENTNLRLSIISERDKTRLCLSLRDVSAGSALQYSEWLQIDALIDTIRDAVGPEWSPLEITFQSRFALPRRAFERFPNVRLRLGSPETSITVPSSLLCGFCSPNQGKSPADRTAVPLEIAPCLPQPDFPNSLKLALRAYLGEGYPDVNLAAEIAGVSPRTLQRRLLQVGLSYRTLIREIRVETAAEILAHSNATALDAAYAVGYRDPSNFSRAFRRVTGLNPRRRASDLSIRTASNSKG